MTYPEQHRPSPNFSATPPHDQLGVLFHHSVMSYAATLAYMADPASQVSYHVLIAPDGTRGRLVADEHIAWHAGASTFLGRTRCNDFLLGLAFAGDTYRTPLTPAQLDSALEWLAPRWARRRWTLAHMADHRSVAPGRKDDLNPLEWSRVQASLAVRFGP